LDDLNGYEQLQLKRRDDSLVRKLPDYRDEGDRLIYDDGEGGLVQIRKNPTQSPFHDVVHTFGLTFRFDFEKWEGLQERQAIEFIPPRELLENMSSELTEKLGRKIGVGRADQSRDPLQTLPNVFIDEKPVDAAELNPKINQLYFSYWISVLRTERLKPLEGEEKTKTASVLASSIPPITFMTKKYVQGQLKIYKTVAEVDEKFSETFITKVTKAR
jgi:hypothetical protein